jgi:hypothetical protein
MSNTFRWLGIAFATLSLLALVQMGYNIGVRGSAAFLIEFWTTAIRSLFDWLSPWVSRVEEVVGAFPTWWREGLLMLAMMISTWVQALWQGHARPKEFGEFVVVSILSSVGSYLIDVAQSESQIVFFGIYGSFVQLLAKGVVALPKDAVDGESWVGKYMLRSTAGAAAFVMANAGGSLMAGL